MFGKQQRKLGKNLEFSEKVIFATSNFKFDYPGRIPRGQDCTDTAQFKSHFTEWLFVVNDSNFE
jgi:hypothetical protein